ncbi:lasso peptide biosynthesis B2 protein [Streptomyces sp. NPDC048213]|uniref:lasso peptide biosynthesis B2 protein n=1 Tax=Streptomyces sp. NPDC048213 TaxID=3160984 RepID=UPI0033C672C1
MPLMAERGTTEPPPPLLVRALAAVALAVAVPAHRLPLRWLVRTIQALVRLPEPDAHFARQVHRAVLAVRPAWWGGRLACMEVSLATVIALGLCGRRAHWVLGARALPNEAHAWVQGQNYVLGLEENDPVRPWTAVLITPPHPHE